MKQKNYIAGLYFRLSQEDERQGESASIDNQRMMLRKYAADNGFQVYDEYIDDGISGTTFNRPGVQRLLEDAKNGVINTIIVKDMSRFGRNYIEIGQYTDYVFPAFGIRFIAIQDNIDTENKNSGAMEMLPIMNIFNEWHAANTSKKIRSIKKAKALAGYYSASKPPYGYFTGEDEKRTFVIDEEIAPYVVRMFEMYASGISPKRIAEIYNEEDIPSPGRVAFLKYGRVYYNNEKPLWDQNSVRTLLRNIAYIGHMAQQKYSTVSYKNHKVIKKDQSEWAIIYNAHKPIVTQELWDKVQERLKSQSHGRTTSLGYTHPLSGFLYCADCGCKMKLCHASTGKNHSFLYNFNCGDHMRFGKSKCFSHYIPARILEATILEDVRKMAKEVALDEDTVKKEFIKRNAELTDTTIKKAKKDLQSKQKRIVELDRLIQSIYEDKVNGKMEESMCFNFIEKYSEEQKTITEEIKTLEENLQETESTKQTVEDFIKAAKKYIDAPELTREMCYELIDYITVSGLPQVTGKDREIGIVYKIDIVSVLRDLKKNRKK